MAVQKIQETVEILQVRFQDEVVDVAASCMTSACASEVCESVGESGRAHRTSALT